MSAAAPELRYRPDIEGLRAVAILLVVGAHAGLPGFNAGFVGVDIFFVLSGYLITGLLVEGYLRHGRIDFALFYAKRFRRLLPALALMLLVTGALGWWLLTPQEGLFHSRAGMAAALWLSNMHFGFDSIDYFGPENEHNLYLHTWSLGVEEQFYLVWPLALLLCLCQLRAPRQSRRLLLWVMGGVAVIGLAACAAVTTLSANFAFYLMPIRAWQFAVGGLVYLIASSSSERIGGNVLRVSHWAGIACIVLALLVVSRAAPYPGLYAALPTAGCAMLLMAGSHQPNNPVSTLLSSRPMQSLGHISYGWYLWHWPALILGAALLPTDSLFVRLLLMLAALILAVMSYRWVEAPIRRSEWAVANPRRTIMLSIGCMALMVLAFTAWNATVKPQQRQGDDVLKITVPAIYEMGCDSWYHDDVVRPCGFGNPEAKRTAVVIGDSVGLQWFPAFERIFTAPDWRLIVLTKSACPIVERPVFYDRIGREYTECASWRAKALDFIPHLNPDLVIIGSADTAPLTKDDWRAGTADVLRKVTPHTRDAVVLLRSTPLLPFHAPHCLMNRGGEEAQCVAPVKSLMSDEVFRILTEEAERWPNVKSVDMTSVICPDGLCSASLDGQLVYRDNRHLNAHFVAQQSGNVAIRLGLSDR